MLEKIMQTIKAYALYECEAAISSEDIYKKSSEKLAAETLKKIENQIKLYQYDGRIAELKESISKAEEALK